MTGVYFLERMQTPAKVNLYLKVTGKRPDGYHEIETLFWPVSRFCDTVELDFPADGAISMSCDGESEGVPCDGRNLCWKAVDAFQRMVGRVFPVHIRLTKRIPVAGGMGGGSSDAAATLLEIRRHAAPELPMSALAEIAVSLGADVPFFLNPVASIGRGVGELLVPIASMGEPSLFIVHPRFPVPASWAYAHFGERTVVEDGTLERITDALAGGDWDTVASCVRNDLEECIFDKYPVLTMLKERMESLGVRHVHISGSGPVLFGFAGEGTSPDAASVLQEEFRGIIDRIQ